MSNMLSRPELVETQNTAFSASLAELATRLPEVAENQRAIEDAGNALTGEFGLQPEFFNDPSRTIFFSAISQRLAGLEAKAPTIHPEDYAKEKQFISDATILLAWDKSAYFEQNKELIDGDQTAPRELVDAVYKSLTNRQVSDDMQRAINEGLLSDVKQRLGITAENEDPLVIEVLNIGDASLANGMQRSRPPELDAAGWQDWDREKQSYKDYTEGLAANAQEFQRQLGKQGNVAPAWVDHEDGVAKLRISLPLAEKILYRDEERSNFYTERDWQADFAVLEHEYTHTQGGLNVDHQVAYGIAAEELRAEHFSGNKQGYKDIKGFFNDLWIVSGFESSAHLDGRVKGGDGPELFGALARQFGLQATLEMGLMVPNAYLDDRVRPLQARVAAHLGGPDRVTKKIFELIEGDPQKIEAMDARLEGWATQLAGNPSADFWLKTRKSKHGLVFITEKLEALVAMKQAELVSN